MSAASSTVTQDQARQRFRAEHQVHLVSELDEGSSFAQLPAGVYGFTYAPATETPVFQHHSYHSFEVHRLPDGSGRMIAFCSPEDAAKLRSPGEQEITACPEPWESATEPVAIPFDWIQTSLYKPVRRDGNAISLHVSIV